MLLFFKMGGEKTTFSFCVLLKTTKTPFWHPVEIFFYRPPYLPPFSKISFFFSHLHLSVSIHICFGSMAGLQLTQNGRFCTFFVRISKACCTRILLGLFMMEPYLIEWQRRRPEKKTIDFFLKKRCNKVCTIICLVYIFYFSFSCY